MIGIPNIEQIRPGQFYQITGENKSGKTSLLNFIAGNAINYKLKGLYVIYILYI